MRWWIPIGAVIALLSLSRRGAGVVRTYSQYTSRSDWGPRWGSRRPPGLPRGARHPSATGAALPQVRAVAARQGLGSAFVRAMEDLARNESGATFGLPAHPPHAATSGWGVFQYNSSAWDSLAHTYYGHRVRGLPPYPWDASPIEEVSWPIARYAAVWRAAREGGASDKDATWAVRMWHRAPALARRVIDRQEWPVGDPPADLRGWKRDAWLSSMRDAGIE